MECIWCNEDKVRETTKDGYWIMPDGATSVQILRVPALECVDCGLYIEDEINQTVEDRVYSSDLSKYPNVLTYEELLKAPMLDLFKLK
ncbi:YokU family protein [Brevibacillus sp. NRS-1366]|uniref:YokU family protein n=1 Tax=Brevibacillus sp. NRS-1366 TaxID=3233899 RepID=UPI003D2504A2